MRNRLLLVAVFLVLLVLAAFPSVLTADHSWGPYHWARTSNPFTLLLGDNVSSTWDPHLATASADWSQSKVLDTTIVAGGTRPKPCRATAGRVEVCSAKYGNTGWLGLAQIWVTGGEHIAQGVAKVNDTYFSTPTYNTPAWRQYVLCQEVGHTFGLDHQDENFDNPDLGTCMDYSRNPEPNQHPNAHDYEQLEIIYAHLDSTTTVGQLPPSLGQADFEAPAQWGRLVRTSADGRIAIYERDFGNGLKVITFVIWA